MSVFDDVVSWLTDPAHWLGSGGVLARVAEHVQYTLLAMGIAALIAIPLGLVLGHLHRGEAVALTLSNAVRALPTLGLLTLLVIALGIGIVPPLIALVVLAVPPMLVNTFEGIRNCDQSLVNAANGLGLGGVRTLLTVELPTAVPVIILGIRLAMIQVISTATIAAYVGLGGLGRFIFDGLATRQYAEVASGAAFVALLAVFVEGLLVLASALIVSPGVAQRPRPWQALSQNRSPNRKVVS
ncbi:MAG TPA: ABC transporter permease [Jiangellaceae bacterium]|nr:ABC transporter permease [Jiangellaceae bacterium]